jgi:hypothetical protein
VLEDVFDLIRGRHRLMHLWDEYLRTSHFNIYFTPQQISVDDFHAAL